MNEQCTGGDVNTCPVHGPNYRETIRQAGIAEGRRLERERGVEVEVRFDTAMLARLYKLTGKPVMIADPDCPVRSGHAILIPLEPTP